MIIAEKIHAILANNPRLPESVRNNIHAWGGDDEKEWEEKFPMITHIDISSSPHTNSLGIWRVEYQVSVWSLTKLEGRKIMQIILDILNRYHDADIEACSASSINTSYDTDTRTNGLHARFSMIFREKTP